MAGSEEDKKGRLVFIPGVRPRKKCTSVKKSAFVSNHLSIKLIHPERERNIQRGRRQEEDERETERICVSRAVILHL